MYKMWKYFDKGRVIDKLLEKALIIHLILKSFVGLIYIRVVPCTTLDPVVG